MSNLNIKKLKDERSQLLAELQTLTLVLHGSWVERYSVCSNKTCKCRKGQRHGPRHYLVVNENGRQRQKYIPKSMVEFALEGIQEYKKLMNIIDKITALNLQLIREKEYGHSD